MKKLSLLLIAVAAVGAQTLADFGLGMGDTTYGVCLGFQDDPTNTGTSCAAACTETATSIELCFDLTTYTD